ncbi:hypothetical protein B0T25DRAFT_570175 [Lasiosphaeria hispida]|uniref:Uncharacterized protein n=1 Tax=Lasiosphaeria hispida TaxID=260671 RepID=A0AAJ0MCI8_9PEZI|nr:hypothetical protein B0T25DRAFT_570175 [Lasiosphaeria hispida]
MATSALPSEPPAVPGVCILTLSIPLGASVPPQHRPPAVYLPSNPSLRASNKAGGITTPTPLLRARPFDPTMDTLYLDRVTFAYISNHFCRRDDVSWLAEIRYLALSVALADHGSALPLALEYLPKLEVLSVVYPGPVGRWNIEEETPVPDDKSTPLRPLTGSEVGTCVVTADYIYEDHGGDRRINWLMSSSQHLEFLRGELLRYIDPRQSFGDQVHPLWSKQTRKLKFGLSSQTWDE